MLSTSLSSRIGYLFKAAILLAVRGGMIAGIFTLIFGSIATVFSYEFFSDSYSGDVLSIAIMPLAVVGTFFGLAFGAVGGALVGLLTGDYTDIILRKIDDYLFALALSGIENKLVGTIEVLGAVFGTYLGSVIATLLDIGGGSEIIPHLLFSIVGAALCLIISIVVAHIFVYPKSNHG